MRAVAYLRVATQEQAISTDKLIEQMKAEIEKLGWAFVGAYVDVGTGLGMNRPGLTQMLGESGADKFDVVYARSSSQLASRISIRRNVQDVSVPIKKRNNSAPVPTISPTSTASSIRNFFPDISRSHPAASFEASARICRFIVDHDAISHK